MTLRVPVDVSPNILADWGRKAANAINSLIGGKQDANANLTSIAGLDLTGHSGDAVTVLVTEDGFELTAGGGGGTTTNALTMNNSGSGDASGTTFDGSAARTISYNTVGAAPTSHTHAAGDITGLGTLATQNGTFSGTSSGTNTGDQTSVTGNAGTATALQTARNINGVSFNGTANITIPGNLIGCQIITATGAGTYTPTSGTNSVVIELQGGGGGGGGVPTSTGTNAATARGGGGGGYSRTRLTSAFSGAAYVVGVGGPGGPVGNNAGTAGTATTFTATGGGGTVYTAGGGTAGGGDAAGAVPKISLPTSGGSVTNGDIQIPGGQGSLPIAINANIATGGTGGWSHLGTGGAGGAGGGSNLTVAGGNATGKGGGGGGAMCTGTGAQKAGGNGSDGVIIIWEYS